MKYKVKKFMALMIAGLMICFAALGIYRVVLFVFAPPTTYVETETQTQKVDFDYRVSNGQAAIVGCNYFKGKVTIPDTLGGYPVTRIEKDVFWGECDEPWLTSISIPASVTYIADNLFESCGILESINVDKGNPAYASENGVLFNKSKTVLIKYPQRKTGSSFTIPNTVTRIEAGAFSECYDLETITIPDSVTSIGAGAFDDTSWYNGQKGLIYAGKMVYGYKEETPVNTAIVLKPGTIGIVEGAFAGCEGVASITVPASVTTIADGAFKSCHAKRVLINEENPAYTGEDSVLFNKSKTELVQYIAGRTGSSYTIPNSVTRIRDKAFYDCKGLKSIIIPDSVKSIGVEAFFGCEGLKSITIPDIVKSIGDGTFSGCTALTSIMIPNGVESIGDGAFSGCDGLKSINIPGSVKSIGDSAFSYCGGLTWVTIRNGVQSIGDEAFTSCSELKGITIPGSVKSIGNDALEYCYALTSVTIVNGLESIGDDAFSSCFGLKSITIPGSVKSIGNDALSCCGSLTSLTIQNGVESIGAQAFYGCTDLKNVTIPKSVLSIGTQAFGYDYTQSITGFTINCFANSAGLKYAKENGFKYKMLP